MSASRAPPPRAQGMGMGYTLVTDRAQGRSSLLPRVHSPPVGGVSPRVMFAYYGLGAETPGSPDFHGGAPGREPKWVT